MSEWINEIFMMNEIFIHLSRNILLSVRTVNWNVMNWLVDSPQSDRVNKLLYSLCSQGDKWINKWMNKMNKIKEWFGHSKCRGGGEEG